MIRKITKIDAKVRIEAKIVDRSQKRKKRKKRDRAEGRKIDLTIHDVWHNHRSFHCIERGCVCTHYNRDIMAHQYVHTTGTEATQNVRCLVSINIGSTGCCYCRPSLVYLWRFFFIEDHMSRAWIAVPWRAAHLSADNLPLSRFDVASQNIDDQIFSNAILTI